MSTDSGIPDYRDTQGAWKRKQPVRFQDFASQVSTRKRYWARSMVGWPVVAAARPGPAHIALAQLQQNGYVNTLVTQNVDGLHQAAGSWDVVDLHGRIERVICLSCGDATTRAALQKRLWAANPAWRDLRAGSAPDGDADLGNRYFEAFTVPDCERCAGLLKPDVVFFGENVPRLTVARCFNRLEAADAVLVVGSSLMVFSGYRFVRAAFRAGLPVALLNLGRTRADDLTDIRFNHPCGPALEALLSVKAYME